MIVTTARALSSATFQTILMKLTRVATDGKTAYQLSKFYRETNKVLKETQKQFNSEVVDKFVDKDEKGEYLREETGEYKVAPEKQEDYRKAYEEFLDSSVKVLRPKLTVHDIRDIKLSAAEIEVLEDFMDMSDFEKPEVPHLARVR